MCSAQVKHLWQFRHLLFNLKGTVRLHEEENSVFHFQYFYLNGGKLCFCEGALCPRMFVCVCLEAVQQ